MTRLAASDARPTSVTLGWALPSVGATDVTGYVVTANGPPRTIEKIDIIGGDYQGVLLEQIDAENLPAFYGGKCECKDVGGCKWSVPMLEGR